MRFWVTFTISPNSKFIQLGDFRMEKIHGRSCSTLAKILGTIVSISGAFIVTLYKGPPLLMTTSADILSHNQLFLPQSNWVVGGMLLGFYCVVAAAWLIIQVKSVKFNPMKLWKLVRELQIVTLLFLYFRHQYWRSIQQSSLSSFTIASLWLFNL